MPKLTSSQLLPFAIAVVICWTVVLLVRGSVPTELSVIMGGIGTWFVVSVEKDKVALRKALKATPQEFINQWLPFPRCWSHIALAIICGSIWVISPGAAILAGVLAGLFVAYQNRQDANCLTQSYLDIREFLTTTAITAVVMVGLMLAYVIPGIYHFTPL